MYDGRLESVLDGFPTVFGWGARPMKCERKKRMQVKRERELESERTVNGKQGEEVSWIPGGRGSIKQDY